MMARSIWLASLAAALALAACGKKDAEAPAADATAETQVADVAEGDAAANDAKLADANLAASEKFLSENGARDGVKTTASGLEYEVLSQGPDGGVSPKETDLVEVHYVGTLIDGVEFDSSRARGAAARFPLNQVIPGWTEGVQLMHEGDRYRFYLPPELAYGATGTPGGPIGPNQALIFDVELLKVISPERNAAASKKFLEDNAKKQGVKTTESGLQYEVLAKGPADGKSPTDANIVRVNYRGTLLDGTEFDSSYARGEPAEFPLARVIPGWTEGVQLMHEGDKFKFYIPSQLAYGEMGTPGGPIGPNEALVFEVELLAVK
ncbi:MAG TPA: FKBP-type peptidyl-prolyl cis-trans isomerase [Parvularculaceae bacterium]|nr:FKBP-type peptidyl-prolyl cis-trans isomerase [Parvularculaceae bacterium]